MAVKAKKVSKAYAQGQSSHTQDVVKLSCGTGIGLSRDPHIGTRPGTVRTRSDLGCRPHLIHLAKAFGYLAVVLDTFSCEVVG